MRVDQWLIETTERFSRVGIPEPRIDAQLLLGHSLGQNRSWILAHPEVEVPTSVAELVDRREKREPLAYILGYREFYGRRFKVCPGILVPRQETETLVEAALEGLGGNVLDIGTGSGCLAITIKLERPNWMVAACDINPVAVRTARENAVANDATVHVARSDLGDAFTGTKFGLIVSNPPYIRVNAELQPEVGDFEPPEALYAGEDGLEIYQRLASETKGQLMPWGRMIVELGDDMLEDVQGVFQKEGWSLENLRNDLLHRPRAATFQIR